MELMIKHCEEKDENVLTYLELKELIFENEEFMVSKIYFIFFLVNI
jgi:hypothetical protein